MGGYPYKLGVAFDATIATSGTDVFSSNLRLAGESSGQTNFSALRIAVAIELGATDRACTLEIVAISGGARQSVLLNGGTALTNGVGYTFTWEGDPAYAYNLRFAGATVAGWASIAAVKTGVI